MLRLRIQLVDICFMFSTFHLSLSPGGHGHYLHCCFVLVCIDIQDRNAPQKLIRLWRMPQATQMHEPILCCISTHVFLFFYVVVFFTDIAHPQPSTIKQPRHRTITMVHPVPAEILLYIGQHRPRSAITACSQVSKVWNQVLARLLWHILDHSNLVSSYDRNQGYIDLSLEEESSSTFS